MRAPVILLGNLSGAGFAKPSLMIQFATIDLWSDARTGKRCRLTVSDDGCEVEIRAEGERMLTAWYSSVTEALACAKERQPVPCLTGPQLAA